VGDVFNQDDEDGSSGAKKRKLVPLDYDDDKDGKKGATAEEKRIKIKQLIESIPTAKEELFAYPLDWTIVDQVGDGDWGEEMFIIDIGVVCCPFVM
jgi:RNA-binding protein 25